MFIALLSHAQEGVIVPLKTSAHLISGTYLKDLDNDLNPYTGFWEGTWDGKKILFKISKKIKHKKSYPSGYYYYEDGLIVRYKITNSSDEDNLNEMNYDLITIKSISSKRRENYFSFLFQNHICGFSADIRLTGDPASNQLEYFYGLQEWFGPGFQDCPYNTINDVPLSIPKVTIPLTRVIVRGLQLEEN